MAKQKQHVFSARTTEEGLKALNALKAEQNIGWDELVIDAVCAHYGLDRGVMALPKTEKPAKEPEKKQKGKKDKSDKGRIAGRQTEEAIQGGEATIHEIK